MRSFFFISFLVTFFALPTTVFSQTKKLNKVVLDAGHGGKDIGARGIMLHEKDIALAVVLKIGKLLNDSLKSVKPIFTRTTDVFIELKDRHTIANQASADLLISVHINASPGTYQKVKVGTQTIGKGKKRRTVPVYKTIHNRETKANGTETYVLGLHRNSQKESAISEYGDNITEEAGMLNVNDPQTSIIVAQYAQVFLNQSVNIGQKIQNNFAALGRKDLGVKQKGLEVLAGCVMPGVLVELGFINNLEEERYLNSEEGQNELAYAIFKAIRSYKYEIEKVN
jgi:N-acetylmuramoyl-L-alanine amidase